VCGEWGGGVGGSAHGGSDGDNKIEASII